MERFHKVAQANFVTHQFCYERQEECPILVETDRETAGLPCVDYSAAGRRQKENGPTASTFCCRAKKHTELGTAMLLLENAQALVCDACRSRRSHSSWGPSLSRRFALPSSSSCTAGAHIYPIYVATSDAGHAGCSRDRIYILLAHKEKVEQLVPDVEKIYHQISASIRKHVATRPSDYLTATAEEVLMEAQLLAHRRRKQGKQLTVSGLTICCAACRVLLHTQHQQ